MEEDFNGESAPSKNARVSPERSVKEEERLPRGPRGKEPFDDVDDDADAFQNLPKYRRSATRTFRWPRRSRALGARSLPQSTFVDPDAYTSMRSSEPSAANLAEGLRCTLRVSG